MPRLQKASRLYASGDGLSYVRFLDDFGARPISDLWDDTISSFLADKTYVVQTNPKVIERCLLMTTEPGNLVFDPTCGSGTTAFVAEKWGKALDYLRYLPGSRDIGQAETNDHQL